MDQPLSLFSFQDIITSVTGVMVLLTLLMAVELIQRVTASPPQQTAAQVVTSGLTLEQMRSEADSLRRGMRSADSLPAGLPSLDLERLRRERMDLDASNERLRREADAAGDDLGKKQRRLAATETDSNTQRQQDEKELAELEQRIDDDTKELEEMQSTNRLYFNRGKESKRVWIVELAGPALIAAELGVQAKPHQFASVDAFTRWTQTLSPSTFAFYLIVKPKGVPFLDDCKEALRQKSFDVGFNVAAGDQQVIDPGSGASSP